MEPGQRVTLEAVRRVLATHVPERMPDQGRPAAVLVPLFERNGRVFVVLTKRTDGLSTHAGQISFPGGKREQDESDARTTALREAHEEIGLIPASVEIIGELDDCPTFVSNFVISPVVGIIPDGYRFVPNSAEIAHVFEASFDDFLRPDALQIESIERDGLSYTMVRYSVAGQVVWGATARILTQLFSLLGLSVEPS